MERERIEGTANGDESQGLPQSEHGEHNNLERDVINRITQTQTQREAGGGRAEQGSIRDGARNCSLATTAAAGVFHRDTAEIDTSRISFCDQPYFPDMCQVCHEGRECEEHKLVTCNYAGYGVQWHLHCLQNVRGGDENGFCCVEHSYFPSEGRAHEPNSRISYQKRALRWGMTYDDTVSVQSNQKRWKGLEKSLLEECGVPQEIVKSIKDHDALPFPEITKMEEIEKERHAWCGRKFELSMMQFCVKVCDCCRFTQPMHIDPECSGKKKESETLLKITAFIGRFHPAI